MLKWLFPKLEKLDFEKEFTKDPTSDRTIKAFNLLNDSEVAKFFRVSSGSALTNIAIFLLSSGGQNNYSYVKILENRIEQFEREYKRFPENAVKNWVTPYISGKDNFKWFDYQSKILKTIPKKYGKICTYLDRIPIKELEEDIEEFYKKLQEEETLAEKIRLEKREKKQRDFNEKRKFLQELINKLTSIEATREKIKADCEQEFSTKFSSELSRIVRINGIWEIDFDNHGTRATVNIHPRSE